MAEFVVRGLEPIEIGDDPVATANCATSMENCAGL
jgi:hypothetical protein